MNTENTLNTTNAHDLLNTTLKPVRYLVDGFLPQGVHILAGSPKIGKSYLALWLCMQIAKGYAVWDMSTTACDVLYISLEDTPERIQKRLGEMTEQAPSNMHLAVTSSTLASGLLEQLGNFMLEHPHAGLIVIDTLQKIREGDTNSYAADYRALAQLKDFADKHKLALLLIHHLRKAKSIDPFEMISGSTGITGAVDSSYVMVQQRSHKKLVSLHAHGRDVGYQELDLLFQNGIWQLIERRTPEDMEADEALPDEVADVLSFVTDNLGFHGTASELMFYLHRKGAPNYFSRTLKSYADAFREEGFDITFKRDGEKRWIHIVPINGDMNIFHDGHDDDDGKNTSRQHGDYPSDSIVTTVMNEIKVLPFPGSEESYPAY